MSTKTLTAAMTAMADATNDIKKKRKRLVSAVKTGMSDLGWTISKLAQEMGVTQAYVSLIIQGKRAGPMPDQLLMKAANSLITKLKIKERSTKKGRK